MENDKLREDIISQIRACLISTKGARDLRQLRSDYLMLMGCEIPYGKLGYKNLEQFVRTIPTLQITDRNGQVFVDAVLTQQSAHIAKFVDKQKTKRRSKPPPRQTNNRRPIVPPRWRPRNVTGTNWTKSYDNQRSATYAHTQVISSPKTPEKKSSVKDRLGPKVVTNSSDGYVESSRFAVNNLKQQLDDLGRKQELEAKPEEITLSKQRKIRLSQKAIVPDENVNGTPIALSPLVATPFPPDFLSWKVPEVPTLNTMESFQSNSDMSKIDVANNFVRTGDHWADLNVFVSIHNLGEISCKTMVKQAPRGRPLHYCTIQIDETKYTNYPSDNFTEDSARQEAAKKALDDLETSHQSRSPLGLLLSDVADVIKRVPLMVKKRPHGVWSSLIQEEYVAEYNEQLPSNWLDILNNLPYIALHYPIQDRCVLNYCEPSEKTNFSNSQSYNVSVQTNTVSFNDDGFLVAEITCINSAAEIWCSQRETSEAEIFSGVAAEMDAYYNLNGQYELASTIQMGGHYVACYEGLWCRVRVFEVKDDNIHCFCIDFGDEWIIKKEALYNLKKEFADVQAQAFVCRLAGLEELYEVSKSSEHLQSFLGKVVQVQQENNGEGSEMDPNDPTLSVVLYDLDTGKPINEEIITFIGIEVASPCLVVNSPTQAYVSHILDDGTVYIQLRSIGYEQLMTLIEKVGQNISEKKIALNPVKVSKSRADDLYFFQGKDGFWYRAKIIDWSPDQRHVQLLHVDNGKSTVVEVDKTEFYILRDINDVISKFPLQALRVKLQLKSVPPNFAERVRNLMPENEPVIVKLIKLDADYVHIVEFFKMSKSDNILFSINLSIAPENELKNTIGDGNNNNAQSVKLQRLISLNRFEDLSQKVQSAGFLSSPQLPEIEQFFDVKVSYALHPHSFFVQPYESVVQLNRLMAEMQETFRDARTSPLQLNDILPGKVYASKYEDGKWYRTSVIRVIHSGSISVFYSDFGYYGSVVFTQLFPLADKFMKLPYQAIKAKLNIQPKKAKWCYEDCDYFKNLVGQKCFVSVLKKIEKDVLCPADIVLTLQLIDTSQGEEDIYIDQILIDAGKAVSSS